MSAQIEVAHFGAHPLEGVRPAWKIIQGNTILSEGTLEKCTIPIGNAFSLGEVLYTFQKEDRPRKLTLNLDVDGFENSWDVWVYPENNSLKADEIKIVKNLDEATLRFLKNGEKVLLSLGKGKVAPDMGGDVGVGFSSIFWNTAWTSGQKPHTLGIFCNPGHPALELFPTEYHSNWQWWDAMSHSDAIQLDSFSVDLIPIVRIIDDWVTNRQLALIFEAKVGRGKVVVCGVDLVNTLEERPEARQLLASLKNYMAGDRFHPAVELTPEELKMISR